MLLGLMDAANGAELRLANQNRSHLRQTAETGIVATLDLIAPSGTTTRHRQADLVIATGGKSIPKMGATGFAYDVARQFGAARHGHPPCPCPLHLCRMAGSCSDLAGRRPPRHAVTAGDRDFSKKRCCSPTAACRGRPFCRPPPTGRRAQPISLNLVPDARLYDLFAHNYVLSGSFPGARTSQPSWAHLLPTRGLLEFLCVRRLDLSGNLADRSDVAARRTLRHDSARLGANDTLLAPKATAPPKSR